MKNPFGTPVGPIWKDLKAFFVAGPQKVILRRMVQAHEGE